MHKSWYDTAEFCGKFGARIVVSVNAWRGRITPWTIRPACVDGWFAWTPTPKCRFSV
jgi:hypothetical protein